MRPKCCIIPKIVHTKNMKKIISKKILLYLIPIAILMLLSLLNLYYAPNISNLFKDFFFKQIIWYILSITLFILVILLKPNFILKLSFPIYLLNIFLLVMVLFFGTTVNGSKAWFNFGPFSFQPSEFMKLSLILYLTKVISTTFLKTNKDHIILLARIIIIFLIPSLLTFLEPDTGAIVIYFFITLGILLTSKIKKRYFFILLGIGTIILGGFICLYFFQKDIFIKIFGSSIFYRIERLTEFKKGGGMQIENALTTIGSAKFFNLPKNAHNLYFPEAATDFIFALSINHFGISAGIIILACYLFLDLIIMHNIMNVNNRSCKIITVGFLAMFLYQQIQNIFMNIGLLPIVGIPLPFLSYGGSSLVLFFISIALIVKLSLEKEKYPYRVFYR